MIKSFFDLLFPVVSLKDNLPDRKKSDVLMLLIAFGTIGLASFVFLYSDMVDMVTNSNLLIRSIQEGKFLSYYTYTLEHSTSAFSANYDFPIYLLFAIWNLPCALIFHYEINGFVYLWFKLLVVICVVVCACLMYRIYRLFDNGDHLTRGTFLLLMFTSPLVFLGEFIAGQYDCISMILILAGLYEYLKGRDRRSLLFFALAVPIKTFAVFLFIPLLVYREKNVLRILLKLAAVFCIPVFCKLLFRGDPSYPILLGPQNRDAANLLTGASISIFNIEVHVFLLIFLLLCFLCYFSRYDRSKVLLLSAAVYTSFILFVPIRSYWVFLAEPFLILLIASRPRLYKVNYLIHTVAAISGSLYFLYSHVIYNSGWMTRSFGLIHILKLPDVVRYGSFSNFILNQGWATYMPLLRTVFIGSCVLLLIINALDHDKVKMASEFSTRALSWINTAAVLFLLAIMVFVELYPCSLPAIDTLDYTKSDMRPYVDYASEGNAGKETGSSEERTDEIVILPICETDDAGVEAQSARSGDTMQSGYYSADLYAGSVIEQPFELQEDRSISAVYFQCFNTFPSRWSRVRIKVAIVDAVTHLELAETVTGGAMITTGEIYAAKIKETDLPKGDYYIRISNIESPLGNSVPGGSIFMMCNTDNQTADAAVIDGERMDYPICVCVN